MKLRVNRISSAVDLPRQGINHDAALDLQSRIAVSLQTGGGRATIPTGLRLEIPEAHVGLILPRSGLAAKHGVTVLNAPGVIDAGYRGEVVVVLINLDPLSEYEVSAGDRIAQLWLTTSPNVEVHEVEDLGPSDRGTRGLGSTGA